MEMLRVCSKNREYKNGQTKFGRDPYHLDIAVGVEFRNENDLLFIAIAKNNAGFEAINRLLSYRNREGKTLSSRAPDLENVFILYPF